MSNCPGSCSANGRPLKAAGLAWVQGRQHMKDSKSTHSCRALLRAAAAGNVRCLNSRELAGGDGPFPPSPVTFPSPPDTELVAHTVLKALL